MPKGQATHASTLRRHDGHIAARVVSRLAVVVSLAALGVLCYRAFRLLP